MSNMITATEVTTGMRIRHDVHENAITVTRVRHDVQHASGGLRVTVINGVDAHGVLVDLTCRPGFEFEPAAD